MQNRKLIFELLRASAVLMVVLGHFSSSSQDIPSILKIGMESISVYGVPLFFVISGILLSASFNSLLKKSSHALLAVKLFYIKRILRIYPAYLVSLFVLAIYQNADGIDFLVHAFNIHNFFDEYNRSINAVYWSLAVEFQWYIIAPAMILLHARAKTLGPILLLLFVLISIFMRFYFFDEYLEKIIAFVRLVRLAQDQLYIHIFNFYIGVVVYIFRGMRLKLPGYSMYLLFVILIMLGYMSRGLTENIINYQGDAVQHKLIISYISILLLGLFVHGLLDIEITEKLYWKPMAIISSISYSLYIYHFPILHYIISWGHPWFVAFVEYILLSLLLSAISFLYVEKYFLGWSSRLESSNYNNANTLGR